MFRMFAKSMSVSILFTIPFIILWVMYGFWTGLLYNTLIFLPLTLAQVVAWRCCPETMKRFSVAYASWLLS
jgi:hypothetical protein